MTVAQFANLYQALRQPLFEYLSGSTEHLLILLPVDKKVPFYLALTDINNSTTLKS